MSSHGVSNQSIVQSRTHVMNGVRHKDFEGQREQPLVRSIVTRYLASQVAGNHAVIMIINA